MSVVESKFCCSDNALVENCSTNNICDEFVEEIVEEQSIFLVQVIPKDDLEFDLIVHVEEVEVGSVVHDKEDVHDEEDVHAKNALVETYSTSDACEELVEDNSTFLVQVIPKEIIEDQMNFQNEIKNNCEMARRKSDKNSEMTIEIIK